MVAAGHDDGRSLRSELTRSTTAGSQRVTVVASYFARLRESGRLVFCQSGCRTGGKGRAAATWAMLSSTSTTSKVGAFANCGRGEFNSCR